MRHERDVFAAMRRRDGRASADHEGLGRGVRPRGVRGVMPRSATAAAVVLAVLLSFSLFEAIAAPANSGDSAAPGTSTVPAAQRAESAVAQAQRAASAALPTASGSPEPGRPGDAAARLKDVEFSWAHDAIAFLVDEGIIAGYPDGTFRPEDPVTRAEFAKMVARAFAIRPAGEPRFRDIEANWAKAYVTALAEAGIISGYPDGTFKPDRHITRAEMVTMLVRVARLAEEVSSLEQPEASFTDVQPDHWAFQAVETAHTLGILPVHFGVVFAPDAATTRAETAWMVKSLVDLRIIEGKLADVDAQEGALTVTTPGNTEQVITCGLDTRIYRNTVATSLDKLLRGDDVYAVADSAGEPKFIKARGLVTKDDVTAKVSILSKGTLTPPDVEAMARGDWNAVKEGLQPRLIERLVERGLTEEEATSLVNQDWSELGDLANERLAAALSTELGISADLVTAVLNRDWQLAKTYGEIEVAQYLLGRILEL